MSLLFLCQNVEYMHQNTINLNLDVPYYQLGECDESTKVIWFVLHGYGQLGKYFIQKFKYLEQAGHLIVAPQGMSKFYLDGHSGRVGANWMTSDDRQRDIENNDIYLSALYESFRSIANYKVKFGMLGFSQGASTLTRWISRNAIMHDLLVLWGGFFAKEIVDSKNLDTFQAKISHIYLSNTDHFIPETKINEMRNFMHSVNFPIQWHSYEGGHKIPGRLVPELAALIDGEPS
jgi:predicted esterase